MARKKRKTITVYEKQSSSGNTSRILSKTNHSVIESNSPSLENKLKEIREERQTKEDIVMARIQADMQKLKGDNQ